MTKKLIPKFLPGGKTLYPVYDDEIVVYYAPDKATQDSLIYLGGNDMETFGDLEVQGAGRISKDGMTWIPNRNSVYYGGTEPLNDLSILPGIRILERKSLSKPLPKSTWDNFVDNIKAFFTKPSKKEKGGDFELPSRITKLAQKGDGIYANDPYGNHDPYALEKGGIVKGQNDLDLSNIDLSGIDFSGILEKASKKLSPKLIEIQERISPLSIDMPTRRDYMEMPKYQPENRRVNTSREPISEVPKRKLLPRDIDKYGILSRRKRALLNNQSEIQPIISGEKLFRDITLYGNTTRMLKKGGILKGQDDIKLEKKTHLI